MYVLEKQAGVFVLIMENYKKLPLSCWNKLQFKNEKITPANEVSFGADRAPLSGEKPQWKIIRNYRCHVETNYNLKMKRLHLPMKSVLAPTALHFSEKKPTWKLLETSTVILKQITI